MFPLGEAGFPDSFSVFLSGQSGYFSTNVGGSLGVRATHSFAPALAYIAGSPNRIDATLEDGSVVPFVESAPPGSGVWVALDGRVATLAVRPAAGCSGTAVVNRSGTAFTYGEVCGGTALTQGRIRRIDRSNGDYLIFTADADGHIGTVANRRGATVSLKYVGTTGLLSEVTTPSLEVFTFGYEDRFLSSITKSGDSVPLWRMTYTSAPKALSRLFDAKNQIDREWTYTSDHLRVATESGPGTVNPATLTFNYDLLNSRTAVSFVDSQGIPRTNTYHYASEFGNGRARLKQREAQGSCPGCGGAEEFIEYWAGTTHPRVRQDANGFLTVYEDIFDHANDHGAAYDALGNSTVRFDGCQGSRSAPNCTDARKLSYTYRAGTRIVASATRPSVSGTTVTNTRSFVGTSSRIHLDRTQGNTALTLGGAVNTLKTRTTKYTYQGVDLTRIDGPFYDGGSGSPPSDAPRTDIAYYGAGANDACTSPGSVVAADLGRVKSITRWVDATRKLTTSYCNWDLAGRPGKIKDPDGSVTALAYNWRGQVTQTIVDQGGLGLTTDTTYDANGNLTEIKQPRISGQSRVGWKYEYDDADRVTNLRHGSFDINTGAFTALESMRYAYDAWGNRLSTEHQDETGATVVSESSKFNAFNQLVELARPAGSATQKTTFDYDSIGNLKIVSDAQGDDVKYGSIADLTKYDRFGKVSRVSQKVCSHPATDPNGACASSYRADVDYAYDPALQLSRATINDAVRGGQIVTGFTTDDFGSIVKVVSPDSGSSFYRYDGAGRLFETQDARGKKFQFRYDRLGRLIEKRNITGAPVAEVTYCYDGVNAPCSVANNTSDEGFLTGVLDKAGKLRFHNLDHAGQPRYEERTFNVGGSGTTERSYDNNGNLTEETRPNGIVIRRSYDRADRLSTVAWAAGSKSGLIVEEVKWQPMAGLKSWDFGTASYRIDVIQDAAGRTTEVSLKNGGALKEQVTYAYANDGNVMKSPATAATPNILHDSLSRLTQQQAGAGVRSFVYDDAGNRTSGPGGAITYSSPSSDRWTLADGSSLTYVLDSAGNATRRGSVTLTVADDGSVSAVKVGSNTTTYTRDFRNLRVQMAGAGGAGTWFHDAAGETTEWMGPQSNGIGSGCPAGYSPVYSFPSEDYISEGGRRLAMIKSHVVRCGKTGVPSISLLVVDDLFWYFSDKMDMPRAVYRKSSTSTATKVWMGDFDAFGNPIGAINEDPDNDGQLFSQPFRLPGQFALGPLEGGPTTAQGGLHDNWNRIYDSVIGRYLQPDPMSAGIAPRPQDGLYTYAMDAPLALTDPMGLAAQVCCRPVKIVGPGSCLGGVCTVFGNNPPQHCFLRDDSGNWSLFRSGWFRVGKITTPEDKDPRDSADPVNTKCAPCNPKSGCDPSECFKKASNTYPNRAWYFAFKRNSNTYAAHLYRSCCEGIWEPGNAPGWDLLPPSL